jgi:hypothetical protein
MVHSREMAQPTQTDPQFKLRLPADLKDQIQASALSNNRSMNSEIVARLEGSFEESYTDATFELFRRQRIESDKEIFELRKSMGEVLELLRNQK